MFQKNIQWFVDRLVERFVPTVGSFMSSALQRMLILNHAEHHNQLEEQALRYEAAGRQEISDLIRQQAKTLTLDDPMPVSEKVLENFDADNPALFEASHSSTPLGLPEGKRKGKARKKPESSQPIRKLDDVQEGGRSQ